MCESGAPHCGVFQTLSTRGSGTRSSTDTRCVPVRFATQLSGRVTGGPEGMSPKYFSTFAIASAALTSPHSTITAFAAP
jgi:hypothetical protein